jgi:hypothetical protein
VKFLKRHYPEGYARKVRGALSWALFTPEGVLVGHCTRENSRVWRVSPTSYTARSRIYATTIGDAIETAAKYMRNS